MKIKLWEQMDKVVDANFELLNELTEQMRLSRDGVDRDILSDVILELSKSIKHASEVKQLLAYRQGNLSIDVTQEAFTIQINVISVNLIILKKGFEQVDGDFSTVKTVSLPMKFLAHSQGGFHQVFSCQPILF